ncbi:MAG: glycogen synthase GlgA [Candidatus Omnitrophota bacterium]|mgnify:CR=1 FL=1|nr:MAG: glycogen synthase GlgA [Candidatus Omnitrophota bacterium]
MKIVICSSEVVPFAKTGGLADVSGALPLALEKLGHEVIIVMPKYKGIEAPKYNLKKVIPGVYSTTEGKGIKVYFIENDAYFMRDGLYVDKDGDYKDNLDRFSYYSRQTLELLPQINFKPDIIHIHDWQACLVAIFLKNLYKDKPFYKGIKTLLTIHNIGYQGLFAKEEFPKLGLDWSLFSMDGLEFFGKINLLKGGIIFCDLVNTVSPTYSKEIQAGEFGFGLEGILTKRKKDLYGVLNGLDYSLWNPETDNYIAKKFSAKNIEDKYKNKEELQKICSLPVKKDIPLFGIVSRLAEQKGFDILAQAIEKICSMELQYVILGTGDLKYHELLSKIAKKYPKVVSLHLKFDNALAHKIYAGSDIFVMPSKYEPCGLGQMISLRYATIPLVFKTGGLADTVTKENGFVFDKYKKEDLIKTHEAAVKAFKNKKKWPALVEKAMQYNFSWEESARKYVQMYEKAKRK